MGLNGFETDGTLIVPIMTIPLTGGDSRGPYSYAHYEQAMRTESLADPAARKRRVDRGAVAMKQFLDAVAETPAEFYVRLSVEIDECREEFDVLRGLLDDLCGAQAPHTSHIRNALQNCRDTVHAVAKEKLLAATVMAGNGAAWVAPLPGDDQELADVLAIHEGNGACNGPILSHKFEQAPRPGLASAIPSREHALLMLQEIAAYFRQTEPHSPLAYTLEQAVRWGRTPLPKLLEELIPDPGGREHYCRLVGIPSQPRVP
jgi:type VI secretion system protein ImpA